MLCQGGFAIMRPLCLLLLVFSAGCYTWERTSLPVPPAPNKRAQHFANVRIYTHGQVAEWHRVRLTHDSISGVPAEKIRMCGDICRRTVGRGDVDSLWVHNPSTLGRVIGTFVGIGGGIWAFYLLATNS